MIFIPLLKKTHQQVWDMEDWCDIHIGQEDPTTWFRARPSIGSLDGKLSLREEKFIAYNQSIVIADHDMAIMFKLKFGL